MCWIGSVGEFTANFNMGFPIHYASEQKAQIRKLKLQWVYSFT